MKFFRIFRSIIAVAITAFIAVAPEVAAREITVTGNVTDIKTDEPLPAVTIFNAKNGEFLGSTTEEGYYQITVDDGAELLFHTMSNIDKTVPVSGRQKIDVQLDPNTVTLGEVVVQAKRITDVVSAEPSEIDVKGNYLHVKTYLKIPRELFGSSDRLIVQPTVYNITKKKTILMQPLVFDGKRYAMTQERMHDWNRSADPLTPFVTIKKATGGKDDIILVKDSVYVEDPNQDYRCDLFMVLEDYNKIIYRDTTTIARGTVNPLRFLEYNLDGEFVNDKDYLPTPALQLRDTKGDVNLTFNIGKTNLDMSLGQNRAEMESLLSMLKEIENNPDMALKSFTIRGTASPDGDYERNRELASGRLGSAMDVIVSRLGESTRRNADIKKDVNVASWSDLAALLRADGLTKEADEVADIVTRWSTPQRQEAAIRTLPYFNKIKEQYLPRLRKVEYEIVTSQYRYLTDAEIADMYKTNPANMSRYEFWRLYSLTDQLPEKESIITKALEVHPSFTVASSDLAALRIKQGKPDVEILDAVVAQRKPLSSATRLNQAVALLNGGYFHDADSLTQLLPDTDIYHKAKIYARATSGHYEDVIQEVAADSPLNEVLLLLAAKANDFAWEKAQKLGDSAIEEYVKAVAANRMDQYMPAVNHLEKAFKLDPSLREIAKVDGDVLDLLEDESLN